MKIVFIFKSIVNIAGGSERVISFIGNELVKRGHEINIVSWDKISENPFYHLDNRINLKFREIGDTKKRTSIVEFINRILDLRQFLKQSNDDVYVGIGHTVYIPLAIAGLRTGKKLIGSDHAEYQYFSKRKFQYILLLLTSIFLRLITVVSERVKSDYPNYLQKKMVVIPNPVMLPKEFMVFKSLFKENYDLKSFLNIGRLVDQKDHMTLLEAFASVLTDYPEWKLRIVGEGPLKEKLVDMTHLLGIEKSVEFINNTKEIYNEYRRATAFILSSKYEPFGLVILEAMSFGLPVAGFDTCSGVIDHIVHDVNGFIVTRNKNPAQTLSEAMRQIIENPTLSQRIGQKALTDVQKKLKLCNAVDAWEKILEDNKLY